MFTLIIDKHELPGWFPPKLARCDGRRIYRNVTKIINITDV